MFTQTWAKSSPARVRRVSDNEIIIFDSTGIAIEDAAAAALVYAKASARGIGNRFAFAA